MSTVILHADFAGLKTKSNHTLDLTFNSSEIPSEQAAILLPLLHTTGYLAFKIGNFTDVEIDDIPEPKPEFSKQKSPSERLRNVLFVYFTQQGGLKENFEPWRIGEMEKMINGWKEKLSPEPSFE
ncbi:MAG: hypothetical protein WC365_08450 [Candidatus Babeliales bacterium]|jgi:hypothetical protein